MRVSLGSITAPYRIVMSAWIRCSIAYLRSTRAGSYERSLPIGGSATFDTDGMVAALQKVIESVAARGNCVIVGRGSPNILRNRPDVFPVFIYAPLDEKIRRLKAIGKSEKEALRLVEEVDRDRAAFIRHYFGKEWPTRSLYNLMINSKCGDEYVVQTILKDVAAVDSLTTAEATV